jgi:hypothetical protein
MDLGLATLNVKKNEQGKNTDTLVLEMAEATLEFDRACRTITKFQLETANFQSVLNNLEMIQTVLGSFELDNGLLHLINGQEHQLCELMGWDELPKVTEENSQELFEGIMEGLGNIAGRTWEAVVEFFKTIGKMIKFLISKIRNLFKVSQEAAIKEAKRIDKLDTPKDIFDEIIIEFRTITFPGIKKPITTISEFIESMKSTDNNVINLAIVDISQVATMVVSAIKERSPLPIDSCNEAEESMDVLSMYLEQLTENDGEEQSKTLTEHGFRTTKECSDALNTVTQWSKNLEYWMEQMEKASKDLATLPDVLSEVSDDEVTVRSICVRLRGAVMNCSTYMYETCRLYKYVIDKLMTATSQIQEKEA